MKKQSTTRLIDIAAVVSGHHSRARIDHDPSGSHWLISAGEEQLEQGVVSKGRLTRFSPKLSKSDCIVCPGDVLFMARGVRNYAVMIRDIPDETLAPAAFFVIRVKPGVNVRPEFLCWWINQPQAQHYFRQLSGQSVQMPVVRRAVLERFKISLPALAVQEAILNVSECIAEEKRLSRKIIAKRTELADALCRRAIQG